MKGLKWMSILLALLLVMPLGVLAQEAPALPGEVEQGMKQAFVQAYGGSEELLKIEYYGEYDGCHVGFVVDTDSSYADAETVETVAGCDFVYPYVTTLYVYRDGQLQKLADAFASGWLSAEAVQRLWNYYANGVYESNPQTGDASVLPLVMLTLSAAALPAVISRRKERI